ncbi:hypothetical protein FRB90_011580 [Tulasnella sp. 427]|nr:hypothetical protein FRB90_011580 [Tulasnella sp. 427]
MSTRPRARPRPRSKASNESSVERSSSQNIPNSFAIAPGKVKDMVQEVVKEDTEKAEAEAEDSPLAYFMMNKKNDARQKQRAAAFAKQQREEAKNPPVIYDLDNDISEPESPGSKRKKKNSVLPTAPKTKLPAWAQDIRKISPVASDGGSDIEIIEVRGSSDDDEDLSPRSKRVRLQSKSREPSHGVDASRKGKLKSRKRTSSPELEPPPALSSSDLADARAAFRSVYPRAARRPSSPDLFADKSTDSIVELNPELQELAKKVRRNNTRAPSEVPSGKPEIVTIRVVYHPHPQDPPEKNPNRKWTIKLKRTDELKPVFQVVASTMGVAINKIKICHNGVDVFKLVTPDSIQSIWADADFDAYLDTTLRYIRENRIASPSKASRPSNPAVPAIGTSKAGTSSKGNESTDDEDDVSTQLADDAIKLYLQGSSSSKKVPVKTRRTATAMALIRHYLKISGVGELTENEVKKREIHLAFDGDEIDYDCTVGEIEDGELEGEECLDVVGL